jgi:hypothetical protein
MGRLSDEDLNLAYSGAAALVYPSRYEGFGLPIVEAMAAGCPVITCRCGSIPEVAGDAAYFVEPDDVAGLARALGEIQRPEIRDALIAAGLEQVKNFSWDRMAGQVSGALLRIADELKDDEATRFAGTVQHVAARAMEPSADLAALARFHALRSELARRWRDVPEDQRASEWRNPLGRAIRSIRASGLAFLRASEADALSSPDFAGAAKPRPRRHAWGVNLANETNARMSAAWNCLRCDISELPNVYTQQVRPLLAQLDFAESPAALGEIPIVDDILAGLARGETDARALHYRAAAPLYFRFHELAEWDPQKIPSWLFDDFLAWTVKPPGLFYEIGEADQFYRRLLEWFERVRTQLRSIPQNDVWRRLAEPMTLLPNLIPAYFTLGEMLPLLRARGDIVEMYLRGFKTPLDMNPPPRPGPGRIRIGILKNHWLAGTETYATLPLFEHLPRDRFEVILYVLQEAHDAAEASCKSKADRFVVLPQDLNEQAAMIRKDRCDVLFYAINMTAVTHALVPLAPHRLAPVQMTSICSPATSGLLNMDYFLAGELTEPRDNAQDGYREKLNKLPGSGICFDYALRPPPSAYTISRQSLKLADDAIVLTSGANYYKVIPELRRAWARMLAAAPAEAVLMMDPFGPAWTNTYPAGSFLQVFQEELRAAGVDPKRLVLLQPMETPTDVRTVMAITDIYVDSFPYTGATSLLDPLEANVPPVTMCGDRLRFAQGEALMRELGMPELIAASEEDYIRIVTELARDRDLRERRRSEIREKMAAGPAFLDSKRFGANAAEMFERLVRGAGRPT